ncbi:hypothetical protein FD29_GL000242 [Companilactobacillus mindensis DSM 14500]|jgi:Mor transcription activator family.|uniref:Mor transcription activator domain-containing protein n=1 Tax=Companilactobacillus mindensis DSM 14500 TaxID=1423770 RepID=A0A0R1QH43_9LACO|nr:Mor transcription activator family protein [Companilactobacillus mindensis]KRL44125.1 hypothetical protein FD29_GL000242 [Companilactobacillus mindensis DSM 14500]GEO79111.1 hypothetical protein LMI01_14420 [Companilactobacillus mindensis]
MTNERIDYDLLNESYKDLVDIIGMDNMLKVRENFGGSQLQLPMKLYDPTAIREMIQGEELNPQKIRDLSHKYGFSPRWFRKVSK